MLSPILLVSLLSVLPGAGTGQSSSVPADASALATVRITTAVLAGGKPLPAGTYQLRLSTERPAPNPGQSPDAQVWVDVLAGGMVVGREVAEVMRDADLPATGASAARTPDGVRVDLLKGGEFLRVSVKRAGTRYLIHLPVTP